MNIVLHGRVQWKLNYFIKYHNVGKFYFKNCETLSQHKLHIHLLDSKSPKQDGSPTLNQIYSKMPLQDYELPQSSCHATYFQFMKSQMLLMRMFLMNLTWYGVSNVFCYLYQFVSYLEGQTPYGDYFTSPLDFTLVTPEVTCTFILQFVPKIKTYFQFIRFWFGILCILTSL